MRNYLVIILLLITNTCFADNGFYRNDGNLDINRNDQGAGFAKVDSKGNVATEIADSTSGLSQSVIPVSNASGLNGAYTPILGYDTFNGLSDTIEAGSTTTVLNLTAHVARVGDAILYRGGSVAANTGVQIPVCSVTANTVTLCYPFPATPGLETVAILRPTPITSVRAGSIGQASLLTSMDIASQNSDARGLLKAEDAAHNSGDAGVVSLYQAESALIQQIGTTTDYSIPKTDMAGRTVITHAPSGQMVAGCNAVISTATTGTILAAVASQFTFVTSLSCTNTGGAATRVILEDGAGNDLANVMLPATTGFATVSFPSPVRTSVVNSVIQANVITTGSATICCASGYTGVI